MRQITWPQKPLKCGISFKHAQRNCKCIELDLKNYESSSSYANLVEHVIRFQSCLSFQTFQLIDQLYSTSSSSLLSFFLCAKIIFHFCLFPIDYDTGSRVCNLTGPTVWLKYSPFTHLKDTHLSKEFFLQHWFYFENKL